MYIHVHVLYCIVMYCWRMYIQALYLCMLHRLISSNCFVILNLTFPPLVAKLKAEATRIGMEAELTCQTKVSILLIIQSCYLVIISSSHPLSYSSSLLPSLPPPSLPPSSLPSSLPFPYSFRCKRLQSKET